MFFDIKMQRDRSRSRNYKLNCKKHKKNHILKETNKKQGTNLFRGYKVTKKVRLMFERPEDTA